MSLTGGTVDGHDNVLSEGASVPAYDAVKALAFIGDLSMGQSTDHSLRTTWLAVQLARAAGDGDAGAVTAAEASLLRWSGCTANASEFADVLGDDIAGRAAMLAARPDWATSLEVRGGVNTVIGPLAQIHCEVSGEIARILRLARDSEVALRHIFEAWDGTGYPDGLVGSAVSRTVFVVSIAGDLEIFSRVYGLSRALELIAERAGKRYPIELSTLVASHAKNWLRTLERIEPAALDEAIVTPHLREATSIELIADVIDMKLPWMTGYSRTVARVAVDCRMRLGSTREGESRLHAAGLIHGIGRSAVPNGIWNSAGTLSAAQWERVRLVPYWTSRAGKQTGTLASAAELASYAYERLDGSGYFRGTSGSGLSLDARVLSAAVAYVALGAQRPWRAALPQAEVAKQMRQEAKAGRFDTEIVEALLDMQCTPSSGVRSRPKGLLTSREIEVLNSISYGSSNKEVARQLGLSPSTVRTHVENAFRKLECTTRAAAVLKASTLGLI